MKTAAFLSVGHITERFCELDWRRKSENLQKRHSRKGAECNWADTGRSEYILNFKGDELGKSS